MYKPALSGVTFPTKCIIMMNVENVDSNRKYMFPLAGLGDYL